MHWYKEHHHYNSKRSRRRFLWLPKTIGLETRWLEFATWNEEYVRGSNVSACGDFWKVTHWIGKSK